MHKKWFTIMAVSVTAVVLAFEVTSRYQLFGQSAITALPKPSGSFDLVATLTDAAGAQQRFPFLAMFTPTGEVHATFVQQHPCYGGGHISEGIGVWALTLTPNFLPAVQFHVLAEQYDEAAKFVGQVEVRGTAFMGLDGQVRGNATFSFPTNNCSTLFANGVAFTGARIGLK
jgi:hypothetical protein